MPLSSISSVVLKFVRRAGVQRLPVSKSIFKAVGVFPIRNHYHEPLFMKEQLTKKLTNKKRNLPGIDFNINKQLKNLENFKFTHEFKNFLNIDFFFGNGSFESGDAEYLYNFIRYKKPKKIVEVGCGYSTLIIQNAIKFNLKENKGNVTEHICIEPYENEYLKKFNLNFKKKKNRRFKQRIFFKIKKK